MLDIAELFFAQSLQDAQAGTVVRFGEDDVETNCHHTVSVEKRIHQSRHLVPAPRPAAFLLQTFLVDIKDHDAIIRLVRQRKSQAVIIQLGIAILDEAQTIEPRSIAKEQQHRQHAQHDQ